MFKSFNIAVESINLSKKQFFIYFIIFFINIPIIGFTGIRFLPAISIFVYGFIGYYKKNRKRYLFYIFISPMFHFAMWTIVGLFLVSLITPKIFMNRMKIFGIIIFLVGNFNLDELIIVFIRHINEIYPLFNQGTYILSEKYGTRYGLHSNILGIIGSRLISFISIGIFMFVIFYFKNHKKYSFIYLGIILLFLLQNNSDPFYRYGGCITFIMILINLSDKFLLK